MASPSSPKYAPGESARRRTEFSDGVTLLEKIVVGHVAVFVVAASWAFGGNASFVRTPLLLWGSLGVLLTLGSLQSASLRQAGRLKWLHCLWPLLLINIQVGLSALNPNFRELLNGETRVRVPGGEVGWLPSAAMPHLALDGLWWLDAIYLSAFNLAFVVQQRRALRLLMLVIGINALVLAVFGTLQKLSGAKGLYFGLVASPNLSFFSTFIYHNHWGPFVLLSTAAWIGLAWHYARRSDSHYRDFFHSPSFLALVAVFFLAGSVALSSSRSCTILMIILLGAAGAHWITRLVRQRRSYNESVALPLGLAGAASLLALAAIVWLAAPVLSARYAHTLRQFDEASSFADNSRTVLYRDTWRMASDKPWFGWGMGSYPTVFYNYNTQVSRRDKLPVFYADAHSDWLQALAEFGFIGTLLLGALGIVPLLYLRWGRINSYLPNCLWGACGLVLLYAWMEFPFGNFAVVLLWWVSFFSAVRYARDSA